MESNRIAAQLERILKVPVRQEAIPIQKWRRWASNVEPSRSVVVEDRTVFLLERGEEGLVKVLLVEGSRLTSSEQELVELLLNASCPVQLPQEAKPPLEAEELESLRVREWLLQELETGTETAVLPDTLAFPLQLEQRRIPFLLYGDYPDTQTVLFSELKRLLESFFETEIVLVPLLNKEWVILGPEEILAAGREDSEGEAEESVEESLASIASGLYEMLSNEWVGECHLTIHYPITPTGELLSTVRSMREAILLGKTFHVGGNLHYPWSMHLEKLLYGAPEEARAHFVDSILPGTEHVVDAEMLATLEQFFALDCNVSETAKKLYIHRNTLLYRLDKFKQETGRDVRSFQDAVLVKTALLLYKVTKRV